MKALLTVAASGCTLTVFADRHLALVLPDRRRFLTSSGRVPKRELAKLRLPIHLDEVLADAIESFERAGRPTGFHYDRIVNKAQLPVARDYREPQGPRQTNRRPPTEAALSGIVGHQIEGVGSDAQGVYMDVKLGLEPVVRIHLLGLTAVELEVKS